MGVTSGTPLSRAIGACVEALSRATALPGPGDIEADHLLRLLRHAHEEPPCALDRPSLLVAQLTVQNNLRRRQCRTCSVLHQMNAAWAIESAPTANGISPSNTRRNSLSHRRRSNSSRDGRASADFDTALHLV